MQFFLEQENDIKLTLFCKSHQCEQFKLVDVELLVGFNVGLLEKFLGFCGDVRGRKRTGDFVLLLVALFLT